jgi:hypothetical protein
MKRRVSTAVALTLAVLLLAPLDANARGGGGGHGGGGGGMRGGFFNGHFVNGHNTFGFVTRNAIARRHFRSFRHRNNFDNFGLLWPWGYGYYGSYGAPYTDDDYSMGYQTPLQTVKKCEHSEETRTVPSVNGGTTEVTILRC